MDKRIDIIGEDSCLLCEIEQNGECKLFSKKILANSPYVTLLNAMFSSSNSSSNSPSLKEVKNGIIYYSIGDLIKSEKDGTELKKNNGFTA